MSADGNTSGSPRGSGTPGAGAPPRGNGPPRSTAPRPSPHAPGDDGAFLLIAIVIVAIVATVVGLGMFMALSGRRVAMRMMAQAQAQQAAAQQAMAMPPAAALLVDRGMSLMSQFEPVKAEEAFSEAVSVAPMFVVRLDRAIAALNQSVPGAQERAIEQLEALIAEEPTHPLVARAHYCLGLAHSYLGKPDLALPEFQTAVTMVDDDGAAHHQLAQGLEQLGRLEEALPEYQRALELDPFLRSSLLGIQRVQARLGHDAEAAAALERFTKLEENPRARLTQFKYTRMGPLSEAIPAQGPRSSSMWPMVGVRPAIVTPGSLTLADPVPLLTAGTGEGSRFAAGTPMPIDLNGDALTDLFVAGAAGTDGRSVFLQQRDDGSYARTENDLTAIPSLRFAAFADYDNDGRTDALVVTHAPSASRLLRRAENGSFAEVTKWEESNDALWADLDHDGDLDLVLARVASTPLVLMNRGTAGFEPLDERSGISGTPAACTGIAVGDVNLDSQLDLVFLSASECQVWINDGFWNWRRDDAMPLLENKARERMIVSEMPETGLPLFASITSDRSSSDPTARTLLLWSRTGTRESASWHSHGSIPTTDDASFQLLDFLGDGTRQVLVSGSKGTSLHRVDGLVLLSMPSAPDSRGVAISHGKEPQLGIVEWGPRSQQLLARPNAAPWGTLVAVDFRGRTDASQSMRSNADGIGTRWSARSGGRWDGGWILRHSSGPGQGRQPAFIAIDRAESTLGALFIDWPDGVIQSEAGLKAGPLHTITETQRQISSCPVIFAWDGARFAFETDCLGVGGLGYLIGAERDGAGRVKPLHAPPRPRESVRLRSDLAEREGVFEIRLTEPMEEACYLDAARLIEWSVPHPWSAVLDERMGINGPEPTGAMRFYRDSVAPTSAEVTSASGAVVPQRDSRRGNGTARARLMSRDGHALEFGTPDSRFIGRLREEGTLTLTFPHAIDSKSGRPALVLDGWVEYPYCQTNFAMWQENALPKAPSIDALDPATNQWITLAEEIGYPAGMRRESLLPLTGDGITSIPPGCRSIRIRASIELYLDRLRLVWLEPCPDAVSVEHPLRHAEVARCGYPRRLEAKQKRADYRYSESVDEWDCRTQPGRYTRFGECTALVAGADSALAIFGPGEEIRLAFSATNDDTNRGRANHERVLVLELDGWCKDMDRFTGEGAALAPLPERTGATPAERSRAAELHGTFNTRLNGGR